MQEHFRRSASQFLLAWKSSLFALSLASERGSKTRRDVSDFAVRVCDSRKMHRKRKGGGGGEEKEEESETDELKSGFASQLLFLLLLLLFLAAAFNFQSWKGSL